MEFFERAHVSKRDALKKDSKSEETVKKQLKQMLHGYKKCDNELIKSSSKVENDIVEMHRSLDDSVSVSGFSDLDLTVSDVDEDSSHNLSAKSFIERVSSSSDINTSSLIDSQSEHTDTQEFSSKLEPILEVSHENVSDYVLESNNDDDSVSDPISLTEESDTSADASILEFEEFFSDNELESSKNDDFDDSSLATEVIVNLNTSTKKGKKRKLEDHPAPNMSKKTSSKSKIKSKKNKEKRKADVNFENLRISENDASIATVSNIAEDSTCQSSPFVSITASEMQEQSLTDILGDYRHPTIRNLPSDKQNIIYSTENSGLFSTDLMDLPVEDVDSLIPELGDDPEVEDLEVDLDTTTDIPIEESSAYDTVLSDSERESSTEMETVNPVQVFFAKQSCIFVLKHPTQLYLNGKVKVRPLCGTLSVFGHILKHEVEVYAPNNSFAQCFKTVDDKNVSSRVFGNLRSVGLTVNETEDIVSSLGEHDCVISMSQLNNVKIDFVENNFSTADLFTKSSKTVDESLKEASAMLGCSLYLTRPWRHFEENERWEEAVECGFQRHSRGIVCGGKGLGKSTFLRYYVNRMLERGPVLVLDLDPGQAEFTVPGCLSATVVTTPLLGPNYTHLRTPEISFNIGMINTMDNSVRYTNAITDLIKQCQANERYSQMPWIINTMGMCNQMGLKFLLLTILQVEPTFLMQIDTRVAKKRFECHLRKDCLAQLYENYKNEYMLRNINPPKDLDYVFIVADHVEGSNRHNTALSPKFDRYLNYLAYFGEILEGCRSKTLLEIRPYEVNIADLNVATNVKVSKESVLKVINGKIVALCQLATGDKGKVFTLSDKPLLCHGHGLVRGVDFEKSVVYVLSPMAVVRLCDVDTIVYEDWAPELIGLESSLPASMPIPYRSAANYTHKQLMVSPRRRFNPLQLLKMSRSA